MSSSDGGVMVITASDAEGSPKPLRAQKLRGRRMGISSESSTEPILQQPAEKVVIPKSEAAIQRIRKTIAGNILFAHLLPDQLQAVVDAMFEVSAPEGQRIINQGEEGDNFYVIDCGIVDIYVRNSEGVENLVLTLSEGGYFGELALMYGCPRAASVVARTSVALWALDRVTFRNILLDTTARKRRFYEEFLVNIPILAPLQKYEIFKVADELVQREYNDGENIIQQGEAANGFFLLEEGEATVFKNPATPDEQVVELKRLKRGDYFGELALLTDKPRAANVRAVGFTKVAFMGSDAFNRLLGPCQDMLRSQLQHYKRFYEPFLNEVPILASLTPEERKQVADALVPVEFQPGDVIVKQGELGDTFFIVETGEAIVTKRSNSGEVAEVLRLTKGDYFGELALLHTSPRAATVTALTPMKCVKLDGSAFNKLLGSCKDILRRNTALYKLYEDGASISSTVN
eukprot:TRINITY_DN813_c0_g1_i1.p1 TRINITY_DN813_c0_g1~~TRINITY_DN813_c0_g1_i1.p1  ORF type:complete len:460 (-),score=93.64 TRINITY_DN813_c0_g1_i1:280-1659(-)